MNPNDSQANSRQVFSNQKHLHPKLTATVLKHLATAHRKPVASHNLIPFKTLTAQLTGSGLPLILDSFCGTGHSTAALAELHPDHLVVGIDKSSHRLARHPGASHGNYLLLQADCDDIWQLLVHEGLTADRHYLLYPNPWPKAKHLQRRIHGHGSFPLLLQLGGQLELRYNWQTYVEEFGLAMHLAGCRGRIASVPAGPGLSLFEQKYQQSGHDLWSFKGNASP